MRPARTPVGAFNSFEAWLSVRDNCAHNRMARQLAPIGCAARWADSPAAASPSASIAQQPRLLALALDNLRRRTLFGVAERLNDRKMRRDFKGVWDAKTPPAVADMVMETANVV